jgi:hypothetical protein
MWMVTALPKHQSEERLSGRRYLDMTPRIIGMPDSVGTPQTAAAD